MVPCYQNAHVWKLTLFCYVVANNVGVIYANLINACNEHSKSAMIFLKVFPSPLQLALNIFSHYSALYLQFLECAGKVNDNSLIQWRGSMADWSSLMLKLGNLVTCLRAKNCDRLFLWNENPFFNANLHRLIKAAVFMSRFTFSCLPF